MLHGLWHGKPLASETRCALSLTQHGFWKEGQEAVARAMAKWQQVGCGVTLRSWGEGMGMGMSGSWTHRRPQCQRDRRADDSTRAPGPGVAAEICTAVVLAEQARAFVLLVHSLRVISSYFLPFRAATLPPTSAARRNCCRKTSGWGPHGSSATGTCVSIRVTRLLCIISSRLIPFPPIQGRYSAADISRSEELLWEEEWLGSARQLCQWDMLTDFGREMDHADVMLDTAWRAGEGKQLSRGRRKAGAGVSQVYGVVQST